MKRIQLKDYAPKARLNFIAAVSIQANRLGINATGIAQAQVQGDVLLVKGQALPKAIASAREELMRRIETHGFNSTIESIAYTWFNRFIAIRYMELHGYFHHGYRVLSHPENRGRPEILDYVADIDLPGLDRAKAVELKLDGRKDEELYRLVLIAQCDALHKAMPFLFDKIGGETELLMPDNLLHTNSLVRQLIEAIDESSWEQIEIIGWLYQFYISAKKEEVIGKVVKSEDIPVATQLFTPNWIVRYMVHNTLGAQWLATYPHSPLKHQMEFYIEPAEQTDDVHEQLVAITPSTLNPEEMTFLDPACGSGHILVEAYDLFKAIYLERGYRQRDVAQLILEKNLFGFDIDERAVQISGFALMMKGREDDRRLFEKGVTLNVFTLVESSGLDAEKVAHSSKLENYGLEKKDLKEITELFTYSKTFGSLIKVSNGLKTKLPAIKSFVELQSQDLCAPEVTTLLRHLVQQADLLSAQYDVVVANPPYIGNKYHIPILKKFLKEVYPGFNKDVFSAFIDRDLMFCKQNGYLGFMTPFVWMFISTHEYLRTRLIDKETITSLVQLEYSGFEGATVPICTFTVQKAHTSGRLGCYIRLSNFRGSENQALKTLEAIQNRDCGWFFTTAQEEFRKIPGSPLAYWVIERDLYLNGETVDSVGIPKKGIDTGENDVFIRLWWELSLDHCSFFDNPRVKKWFPYNKGGEFRRWYGNRDHVLNWFNDGAEIKARLGWTRKKPTIRNSKYFFREGFTWTTVSSGGFSLRYTPMGAIFDNGGCTLFCEDSKILFELAALLNSKIAQRYLDFLSPTLNFQPGNIGKILYRPLEKQNAITELVELSRTDWNNYERSWDFQSLAMLNSCSTRTNSIKSSYDSWITHNLKKIKDMKYLEEENNRLLIHVYGLEEKLTPHVPIEQITISVNPAYRYGGNLSEEDGWNRFCSDTMKELISYAIGCMMGRYSLDEPGLIYANSDNRGFDSSRYITFPVVDDGIVPLTDTEWFNDDACLRLFKFIELAWEETLIEENLEFLAANLSPKKNEASRQTIRRYLCDSFFKDHLKTYKRRPIYWLFASGKLKAFQCLVYLHRYNESTLSRMRSEYVIPLQGKMAARLEKLREDIKKATSTSYEERLKKEQTKLLKQEVELLKFDEKLRHYADQRIKLDLDDGVKVNYGKFGDLLAEVKTVHGRKAALANERQAGGTGLLVLDAI